MTTCTFTAKRMCHVCPFRKDSPSGWLGNYTIQEIMADIRAEVPFYCHNEIDYEDENWRDHISEKPHCAGALQMTKLMCKLPRDNDHANAVKAIVVQPNILTPTKFLEHHSKSIKEVK